MIHTTNIRCRFLAAEKRLVFVKEAAGKQYEKQEAIDIVKLESDKQVAVVQQKLDKIGGKFKGELYDRLYEYYRSGAERAAKDGKLDQAEFDRYKSDMLKKTDEILKQFVPTDAQIEAKKREAEAAKELAGTREAAEMKLGEIPKELPEDTPAEKIQEKLQEYGNLSQAFNGEAQAKLGDIGGFFTKLQEYQDAKNASRLAYTWDKMVGIVTTSDDDKKVAELREAKGELEGDIRKKKNELDRKKGELEKYGKSIGVVLAKKRRDLLKARDADVKKMDEEQAAQSESVKEREARYREFKKQEEQLKQKKSLLEKSRDNLEKLRTADDSPQAAALIAERKKDAMERVYNAESGKEEMLVRLLAQKDLTDEQKEAAEEALTEIRSRKKKADDGKKFLARGIDASKAAKAGLSQDERAVAENLGTVESTLETFVYPSIQSLDENILMLKTYKDRYADCAEGIKDKYAEGIESVEAVHAQTDDYVLQCSLSNGLSMAVLDDAYGKLESLKIDKQGALGAVWDGAKDLYQGSVGKLASVPGDLISDAGKWIIRQGNLFQNDARAMEGWGKYFLIPVSEVSGLTTGFAGGVFELAGGVLNIFGKPFDLLEGVGALVTINKQTGEIGDLSMAGQAWKGLGKGLIAYDEFAEGHVSTGAGKVIANIASVLVGTKGAEKAGMASAAARTAAVARVTAAGGKAGFFTGRLAEAGAFMRVLGQETFKMPAFLRKGGDVARAANLGKAAGGALKAVEAVGAGGAETTAKMAAQGGKALKAAERVERAARAAEAIKLSEAEALASELKRVGQLASKAKVTGNIAKMEQFVARAKDIKIKLGAAKEAAKVAGGAAKAAAEAAEKMRLAQAAIKEAQVAETALAKAEKAGKVSPAARAKLTSDAASKATAAADAIEIATRAAEAANAAAGKIAASSPTMALAKSFLKALPGGRASVARFHLAEGAGAKTAAVLKGTASVTGRTALEVGSLAYRGTKFLVYELPVGVLRGTARILRAIPKITRAILGEGVPGFALRLNKVGRALRVLEREGPQFTRLAEVFEKEVTRNPQIVEKILNDIKGDAVFGEKFKGMNWDEVRALVAADSSLNRLGAAHPEFAKVFENRALTRFLEMNGEAAVPLMRIQESLETVLAFGKADKRVAEIINGLFGRKLYEAEAAAGEVAAAGAKAEAGAEAAAEAGAAAGAEARIGKDLVDDYARAYAEANKHPSASNFILREPERNLVNAFREKYAAEADMTAEKLAAGLEKEFGGLKFRKEVEFGEVKLGDASFVLKADEAGAMRLFEAGKAEPVSAVAGVPAGKAAAVAETGAAKAVAPETVAKAAPEAGRGYALGRYMRGKIDSTKALYARWKASPSKSLKGQIYKLLTENAAIVVNIPTLEKLHPEKSIDERIEEIEDRIAQIEAMEELPPDTVLPAEVDEMIRRSRERGAKPPAKEGGEEKPEPEGAGGKPSGGGERQASEEEPVEPMPSPVPRREPARPAAPRREPGPAPEPVPEYKPEPEPEAPAPSEPESEEPIPSGPESKEDSSEIFKSAEKKVRAICRGYKPGMETAPEVIARALDKMLNDHSYRFTPDELAELNDVILKKNKKRFTMAVAGRRFSVREASA